MKGLFLSTPRSVAELRNPLRLVVDVLKLWGNDFIEGGYIRYPHIERELMMYKNPTVIIVADQAAADAVRKDVMFQLTPAARRGFIVSDINPDLLLRPGPRFPIAMRRLQTVFRASVPHE